MSYSLNVRAASLIAAVAALTVKFDEEVLARQPYHSVDKDLMLNTVDATAKLVVLPDDKDVMISVSGGIGGQTSEDGKVFTQITSANIGVNVYSVARPPAS